MRNIYQPGNVVILSVAFTTTATPPVPVDPTTIVLRVIDPNGKETDYSYSDGVLTKNSTGNYSYPLEVLLPGVWYYRFEGAGTVFAASEQNFLVSLSNFASPL